MVVILMTISLLWSAPVPPTAKQMHSMMPPPLLFHGCPQLSPIVPLFRPSKNGHNGQTITIWLHQKQMSRKNQGLCKLKLDIIRKHAIYYNVSEYCDKDIPCDKLTNNSIVYNLEFLLVKCIERIFDAVKYTVSNLRSVNGCSALG